MRPLHDAALAIWSVTSRPLRSALMVLILGTGVAAVVLSIGILQGFSVEIERLSYGAYARSVVISPNFYAPERAVSPQLTDLDRLRDGLPQPIDGAAAWRIARRIPAQSLHGRRDIDVYGVMGDYRFEADMPLASGRLLSREDLQGSRRVCLLGHQAAGDLLPRDAGPLRRIRVNGISCDVVGVFAPGDTRLAARFADAVIAPFHVTARYFTANTSLAPGEADRLTVVLRNRDDLHSATISADRLLRRQYGAPLSQASPFLYADPGAPVASLEQQRTLIARLLFAIAAISLAAAVIGYGANTWSAVTMRRRDIGLVMAHGAYPGDIFLQFSVENLLLGLAGGLAGMAMAVAGGAVMESIWGWTVILDLDAFVLASAVGAAAGFVSGVIPAYRAAMLDPSIVVRN
ncbi:ABC transporter permease [Hyphobacterium marinum]|uniref:ABC transporter permease n=1 Tax=Hyphobacterium marinum TaxID=3116574 RepID=A0ABU7M0R1_9PROT|nr:ABC transporter permease [Hyphobacterium sp. Y6023]MEE2566850.1 ABC transporter permease [Hyphobacterium sp. Y6023]